MAMSPPFKVALIAGGLLLAGGVTYVVTSTEAPKKKKKKKKVEAELAPEFSPGLPPVIPGLKLQAVVISTKDEPVGGWEFQWESVKDQVIPACKAKLGKTQGAAWTDFWRCVAREAFPNTATTLPYEEWPNWLRANAATRIRKDVMDYLDRQGVPTQGWRFMLWLRFDGVIQECYEALAPHAEAISHCVAMEIYPDQEWPPSGDNWQQDFWQATQELVDGYIRLLSGDVPILPDGLSLDQTFQKPIG